MPANPSHSHSALCTPQHEWLVSQYADGELPAEREAELFSHLAGCRRCRHTFNAILRFRTLSRQEYLSVPPAVDDALMKRLTMRRDAARQVDRAAERRPLWQSRTPVSLRAGVVALVLVFFSGFLLPLSTSDTMQASVVLVEDEHVRFDAVPEFRREQVIVFYPGLLVEADRVDPAPDADPL